MVNGSLTERVEDRKMGDEQVATLGKRLWPRGMRVIATNIL